MQLLVIVPKNCLPASVTYYRNFVDIFGIYRENVMYYLSIHAYYRDVKKSVFAVFFIVLCIVESVDVNCPFFENGHFGFRV